MSAPAEYESGSDAVGSDPLPAYTSLDDYSPKMDCRVAQWGEWSDCSVSCGTGRRYREEIIMHSS